jgi:hypothetical protein
LKVSKELDSNYSDSFGAYLGNLISVTAESHDYFAASQISRNIDININCENMSYANFDITKEQIENLVLQGESAADQQLKEFNYNFNHILGFEKIREIEEISAPVLDRHQPINAGSDAAKLAETMIAGFKNELVKRDQVFVSYSHLDTRWLEKLNISLSALERFAGIKAWSDKLILTSDIWNAEIQKALSSAKVAVFLVTPNFLASKFIQENEMNYFLEINKKEKVPIVWINISSNVYDITPLQHIQCANNPAIPLDTLSEAGQNMEITSICKKILNLMQGSLSLS